MEDQETNQNIVWLSEKDRIASFHPVDGYESQSFSCHEFFMAFLHTLQERGFRFQ